MGIRKSTRIENYRMVHTWVDDEFEFVAEVNKVEGRWIARVTDKEQGFDRYQQAVDFIMDEYRLVKAGLDSWEGTAAVFAADRGLDWESLSDEEAQDFIDAARSSARYGAL